MNKKIKFHRAFQKLWNYRLDFLNTKNAHILTGDIHQIILHLSVVDYHLKSDGKISWYDWNFINERIKNSQDFIVKDKLIKKYLPICWEILDDIFLAANVMKELMDEG